MTTHQHNSNHEAADSFTGLVREAISNEALPAADPYLREALLKRLDQPTVEPALKTSMADRRRTFFQRAGIALASTAALALVGVIWQRPALERAVGMNSPDAVQTKAIEEVELQQSVRLNSRSQSGRGLGAGRGAGDRPENEVDTSVYESRIEGIAEGRPGPTDSRWGDGITQFRAPVTRTAPYGNVSPNPTNAPVSDAPASAVSGPALPGAQPAPLPAGLTPSAETSSASGAIAGRPASGQPGQRPQDESNIQRLYANPGPDPNRPLATAPAKPGEPGKYYMEQAGQSQDNLIREVDRLQTFKKEVKEGKPEDVTSATDSTPAKDPEAKIGQAKKETWALAKREEVEKLSEQIQGVPQLVRAKLAEDAAEIRVKALQDLEEARDFYARQQALTQVAGEQYAKIIENQFQTPLIAAQAKSTFAIDVDTASYANVRRFLTSGQLPPPDAVRLEEMVNYFKYQYPQPKGDDPFSVNTEMADCPWQPGHKLLRVGVQGKEIHRQERPASNIVFLIDTSGSMTDQNKLPLLKQAFTMLVGELNENDKVTMVTYAGNAGLKLPPTRGHEKESIIAAIEGLQSGGSTHGSAGISLAYEVAAAQFIKGGTNKVILATDGDLNVGITDDAQLVDLITKKAKSGVYLTVLGVGTGNLKDAKMERLANNGNGIYAYLDTVKEARKVLVEEMSGSLVTIAKDVKIQLEFNPNYVHSYRLLGYENRVMANKDFENDQKDAGEIGAGHSVTAMYEVVLVGADKSRPETTPETKTEAEPTEEPLRYQRRPAPDKASLTDAGKSEELLMVKLRYKTPEAKDEDKAKQLDFPVKDKGGSFNSASKEFQFASSVVAFGLALRQSEYRGSANFSAVAEIASATLGEDVGGHRAEFVELVKRAKTLRGE